ncbi:MAG: hypothetical protein ACOYXT_05225 [Bacteroidota bacterium]
MLYTSLIIADSFPFELMMIRLLLSVVSLVGATGLYGQVDITSYQSFQIDNKEIVWIQIFHEPQASAEDLAAKVHNYLKTRAWVKNIQHDGNDLVADLERYRIDYKRYGGKYLNTSTVIRSGKWFGKLRVSFKEGKYRIVAYDLNYVARQVSTQYGKMGTQNHELHGSLNDWALNKYRTSFKKSRFNNLDLIHFNLKNSFTLTENQIVDNDW